MSPRANVRSIDAIRQVRPAVVRFGDDVAAALTGLRTELNRTLQWLDHDCPAYWQQQIRNGFDSVNETRTQLTRKQMMTVAGRHPDCIDEKKAFARAKQQLEFAQEKLRVCRQWSIKAHRAADEYSSRIGRTEQAMGQGLPRIMAILERIVLSLEAYTALKRPSRSDALASGAAASAPEHAEPPVTADVTDGEPAAPQSVAEAPPDAESVPPPANSDAIGANAVEADALGADALGADAVEAPIEPSRSRP